jgi:hypothetical protein
VVDVRSRCKRLPFLRRGGSVGPGGRLPTATESESALPIRQRLLPQPDCFEGAFVVEVADESRDPAAPNVEYPRAVRVHLGEV